MPKIKHQTYIKADPERIFKTLTSAEGWNTWFTDRTTIDWSCSEGAGTIQFRWRSRVNPEEIIEDGGKIEAAIPNHLFIFQWSPGNQPTTVQFKLIPYEQGTVVTIEEAGYTLSEKDLTACVNCAVGWGEALTLLKTYLEQGFVFKDDLLLDQSF